MNHVAGVKIVKAIGDIAQLAGGGGVSASSQRQEVEHLRVQVDQRPDVSGCIPSGYHWASIPKQVGEEWK